MFIHWGLYSVPAGTHNGQPIGGAGEWIMLRGKIPVAEYAKYAGQFNPVKFNADEWVSANSTNAGCDGRIGNKQIAMPMTDFINLHKLTFLLLCVTGTLKAETNWHLRVERWLSSNPMEIDIRTISQEDKKEVVAELRGFGGHRAEIQLLRLGDEQTIAEVIQHIRSDDRKTIDDGWGAVAYVKNPALIPVLAELLYLPEEAKTIGGPGIDDRHIGVYTRPMRAVLEIKRLLEQCPEFSSELKHSVGIFWRISAGQEALRVGFRQWWEQNKEAFVRKDYAAVKPLQPVAVPLSSSVVTNRVPPTVPPINGTPTPKPTSATPPVQSKSSTLPLVLLIGVVGLVLVVVIAVAMLRRKK